jgi:urease accessory protein
MVDVGRLVFALDSRMSEASLEDRHASTSRWCAELHLRYERDGTRSVLRHRRHLGPLVVQKSLYPEGEGVCQNIVVHPPGGVAGGDTLMIDVRVDAGAHAQLTTPGAGKWYRSSGVTARHAIVFTVGDGAALEWLPQENIVFDGASAHLDMAVHLGPTASYVGWDIACLGRTASGERFERGELRTHLTLRRDDKLVFTERLALTGGSPMLASPVGLHGQPVFGTFLATGPDVSQAMLVACRELGAVDGEGAVTRLPGLIVARYRGASCEAARAYFAELWARLRPLLLGREAVPPRIWKT